MASRQPDPLVVIRAREFKAALLAREDAQMREMARRWLGVERSLAAEIEALIAEVKALRERGETVNEWRLFELEHFQRLLAQAQIEFGNYAVWTGERIAGEQRVLAEAGLEHAAEAIQLTYWQGGVLRATFNRLPVEAIEVMVGLAGDGSPVGDLLRRRMVRDAAGNPIPEVWERLTQTLVDATAKGVNPRVTARRMRDDLAGGLRKAMTIARTEQLRAYRLSSTMAYEASGVVTGHKRLTAHDDRVCAACIADEGTVYPVGIPIGDHPQGRCTSVPVVSGLPEVQWLSGETWFRQQSTATQRQIMGAERWDAWNDGRFGFGQLAMKQYHPVWGESLQPAPLSALISSAN
jgi:hypothetical protein